MLAQEIIRTKRDGLALSMPQIESFVHGLTDNSWSEGQVAALAMAVFLRGMGRDECVALTHAMMHSGRVMAWPDMPGPVLDKHSSGGVGDKISLMLAPMVAACGGYVPMVSGRGRWTSWRPFPATTRRPTPPCLTGWCAAWAAPSSARQPT